MNNLFIISGPSCAGEDSAISKIAKIIDIERVITTTTREMRIGESQGNPYYFVSRKEFEKDIKNDEFIEHALAYNNNYYGTTRKEIERVQKSDKTGIWKIEYKGVRIIKNKLPDIIAILINAPLEQIERRLRGRKNTNERHIQERIEYTKEWLKHKNLYNHEVMNYDNKLNDAVKKILQIIQDSSFISSTPGELR